MPAEAGIQLFCRQAGIRILDSSTKNNHELAFLAKKCDRKWLVA